jgi:osmoprotectant transport system ATP-binding protein
VSSFVGRDRGYRALGFLTASGVPVGPVATVKVGEPAGALEGEWAVAVDADNKPLGWVSAGSTKDEPVSVDGLVSGGSLFEVDSTAGTAGSLRNALDAALSSPAAVGIAVDKDGAVVGGVTADTVLAALADARRSGEVPT